MFKGVVSGCCLSRCGMVLAVALLWSGTTASNAFGRACCQPDNGGYTCSDLTKEECQGAGGLHGTQDSVCDGFLCDCIEEDQRGCKAACCLESGDCQTEPPWYCRDVRNGTPNDGSTTCEDPCTAIACAADMCDVAEPDETCDTRACVLASGDCVDVNKTTCELELGGTDQGKFSSCNEAFDCDPPRCGDGNVDDGEECDDGNNDDGDGCSATCDNEEEFAGCTPGFWKQPQHLQYWVGYNPNDSFNGIFGDCLNPDAKLIDAAWLKGGKVNALARHAVAALLNASSGEVNYPFTEAEVIAAVNAACASGEFNATKDDLEDMNEIGCTVDKSQGED